MQRVCATLWRLLLRPRVWCACSTASTALSAHCSVHLIRMLQREKHTCYVHTRKLHHCSRLNYFALLLLCRAQQNYRPAPRCLWMFDYCLHSSLCLFPALLCFSMYSTRYSKNKKTLTSSDCFLKSTSHVYIYTSVPLKPGWVVSDGLVRCTQVILEYVRDILVTVEFSTRQLQ